MMIGYKQPDFCHSLSPATRSPQLSGCVRSIRGFATAHKALLPNLYAGMRCRVRSAVCIQHRVVVRGYSPDCLQVLEPLVRVCPLRDQNHSWCSAESRIPGRAPTQPIDVESLIPVPERVDWVPDPDLAAGERHLLAELGRGEDWCPAGECKRIREEPVTR